MRERSPWIRATARFSEPASALSQPWSAWLARFTEPASGLGRRGRLASGTAAAAAPRGHPQPDPVPQASWPTSVGAASRLELGPMAGPHLDHLEQRPIGPRPALASLHGGGNTQVRYSSCLPRSCCDSTHTHRPAAMPSITLQPPFPLPSHPFALTGREAAPKLSLSQ